MHTELNFWGNGLLLAANALLLSFRLEWAGGVVGDLKVKYSLIGNAKVTGFTARPCARVFFPYTLALWLHITDTLTFELGILPLFPVPGTSVPLRTSDGSFGPMGEIKLTLIGKRQSTVNRESNAKVFVKPFDPTHWPSFTHTQTLTKFEPRH